MNQHLGQIPIIDVNTLLITGPPAGTRTQRAGMRGRQVMSCRRVSAPETVPGPSGSTPVARASSAPAMGGVPALTNGVALRDIAGSLGGGSETQDRPGSIIELGWMSPRSEDLARGPDIPRFHNLCCGIDEFLTSIVRP